MAKPCLERRFRFGQSTTGSELKTPMAIAAAARSKIEDTVLSICDEISPKHGAVSSLTGRERHWYALYTASNQEKRVDQQLRTKGIEAFLPLYSVTKRWKNRT